MHSPLESTAADLPAVMVVPIGAKRTAVALFWVFAGRQGNGGRLVGRCHWARGSGLVDRPRHDAGRLSMARSGSRQAMYMEELEDDPHNPFSSADEPSHNRWMLTTCVAGIAGSMVIGSALLGFLSDQGTDAALASLSPAQLWQRTQDALKGDYNGEIAQAVALKPYREVSSVAYRVEEESVGKVIQPAREITGSLAG